LHVLVAKTGRGHRNEQAILDLDLFEVGNELEELDVERIEECLVYFIQLAAFVLWDDAFERGLDELEAPVGEVTKVAEELIVVLSYEVLPEEDSVVVLWSIGEQVVSPNLARNSSLHGIVSKDTSAIPL